MESTYEIMTEEEFKKQMMGFKAPTEIHFFLLNVLNLILHNGWYYCFCEKFYGPALVGGSQKQCTMCGIPYYSGLWKRSILK